MASSKFISYYNRVFERVRNNEYVHPKLEKLKEFLVDHFRRNAVAKRETRVIVFAQYRSSVQEILNYIRGTSYVRATAFVGQQKKNGDVAKIVEEGAVGEQLYDAPPPKQARSIGSFFGKPDDSPVVTGSPVMNAANGQTQKQQQAILIRAEDDALYNKPEDLSGHKVGVQNGTIQVPIANELAGEENVVGLVKAQDLIMELKSGKLDVVYIDYTAALAFAAANDDLTVKDIGIESDSEGQCIGVQKGNEDFVAYLNEKIAEMQEQGLIDQYVAEAQTLAGIE